MQLRPLPLFDKPPLDPHCEVLVLGENDKWPAEEFLKNAASKYPKDFRKLLALLDRCVFHGMPNNEQKVRFLEGCGGLAEFKAGCLRLFWFWDDGKMVICTHGIVKKTQKTPKKDVTTAVDRMQAFRAAKKRNNVKVIR